MHPTPLYEAIGALAIAAVLSRRLGRHAADPTVFAWYLMLSGGAPVPGEGWCAPQTYRSCWDSRSPSCGPWQAWSGDVGCWCGQSVGRRTASMGDPGVAFLTPALTDRERRRAADEHQCWSPHILLAAYSSGPCAIGTAGLQGPLAHLCPVSGRPEALAGITRLLDLLDPTAVVEKQGLSMMFRPPRASQVGRPSKHVHLHQTFTELLREIV